MLAVVASGQVKSNSCRELMTWILWLSCTRAEVLDDGTQLGQSLDYIAQQDLLMKTSTVPEAAFGMHSDQMFRARSKL